jgi:hypothetical protein
MHQAMTNNIPNKLSNLKGTNHKPKFTQPLKKININNHHK